MDMVDEKWEWRRKAGVASGRWAWLMGKVGVAQEVVKQEH